MQKRDREVTREEFMRKYASGPRPQPLSTPGLPAANAERAKAEVQMLSERAMAGEKIVASEAVRNNPLILAPDTSRLRSLQRIKKDSLGLPQLNTPERLETFLRGRKEKGQQLNTGQLAFLEVQEQRRIAPAEQQAFLAEYAEELKDILNAETFPERRGNQDSGGFIGEDLTGETVKRKGFNEKTQREAPNPRERPPVSYIDDDGGAGIPRGLIQVGARNPATGKLTEVANINPNQVVDVVEDLDKTAGFMRSTEIALAEQVSGLLDEGKTPVMVQSALDRAEQQGRFIRLPEEQRLKNIQAAKKAGKKDTYIGDLITPEYQRVKGGIRVTGEKRVPVYEATAPGLGQLTTTRVVPATGQIQDVLNRTQIREELLYRVGSPVNRDFDAARAAVVDAAGPTRRSQNKQVVGSIAAGPLVDHVGVRYNLEQQGRIPNQAEFFKEISTGKSIIPEDVADSYKNILAAAAATGEMPVRFMERDPETGKKRPVVSSKPMRGSVESLYSNINPKTGRNRQGTDSPESAAGKQLRAFLQETPRAVNKEELLQAAFVIGERFKVSPAATIAAAAARVPDPRRKGQSMPANDPGRPLFAEGSYSAELLRQAVAERSGTGREVDLFAEPGLDVPVPRAGGLKGFTDEEADQVLGILQDAGLEQEAGRSRNMVADLQEAGYTVIDPARGSTPITPTSSFATGVEGSDPLQSYVNLAKEFTMGDERQARYIVEQALIDNPRLVPEGGLQRAGISDLAVAEAIRTRMNQPVDVLRSPSRNAEIARIRETYRNPQVQSFIRATSQPEIDIPERVSSVSGLRENANVEEFVRRNVVADRIQQAYDQRLALLGAEQQEKMAETSGTNFAAPAPPINTSRDEQKMAAVDDPALRQQIASLPNSNLRQTLERGIRPGASAASIQGVRNLLRNIFN